MDKRMMMAWLQGQAQKQELTTTRMQQKRLGIKEEVYPPRPEPGVLPDKKPKPRPLFPGLPRPAMPREPFYDTPLAPKEPSPLPVKPTSEKPRLSSSKLQETDEQISQIQRNYPSLGSEWQQKRLGIDLNEQLSAEEEKYAKEHKSMLASMIKQYGKEKGTSVFYGKVRKAVRGN